MPSTAIVAVSSGVQSSTYTVTSLASTALVPTYGIVVGSSPSLVVRRTVMSVVSVSAKNSL